MRQLAAVVLYTLCLGAFAQKPNINKAKTALDKGELEEAKAIIDQAIAYEKTEGKAKTWYYRGMIYMALDTTNRETGALATSIESYKKALEIDPEQKSISTLDPLLGIVNVDSKLQNYFSYYYNVGVKHYQGEAFSQAADHFEKAAMIKPGDTSSYLYAAYAATAAEEDERSIALFKKAIAAGVKEKVAYLRLYNADVQAEKFESALETIRKAKEIYPGDPEISQYEIGLLIRLDKIEEAKSELEEAIEKNPDNADLYFNLGVIHEELKAFDEAKKNYRNALNVDENHFNSNFNFGVMIFNTATAFIKERNALSYKEEKKYDELTVKINEKLTEALPIWEKLYSLKSTERNVLETLKYIYSLLDMNEKEKNIAEKLEQLGN